MIFFLKHAILNTIKNPMDRFHPKNQENINPDRRFYLLKERYYYRKQMDIHPFFGQKCENILFYF